MDKDNRSVISNQPTGHIDTPNLASFAWKGDTIIVSGWAIGVNRPLDVRFDAFHCRMVEVNEERKDVAEYFGLDYMNVGFSFELPLDQATGLHQITITTADGGAPIASTEFVILDRKISSDNPSEIRPITVTSFGRSGSTLLMQTLFSLPEVIGHREYPFETRIAQYWLNIFRTLQALPGCDYSEERLLNFIGNVGPNPFGVYGVVRRAQLEALPEDIAFIKRRIALDYFRVSGREGDYFAEKTSPSSLPLCEYLFCNVKHIYLTRDILSLAASVKRFNKKQNGATGFSYEGDFKTYILGPFRNGLMALYASITNNPSCFVLPYRALIETPQEVSVELGNFMFKSESISMKHCYQEKLFEALRTPRLITEHMTSRSVQESLNSWDSVLDEDERLCCGVVEEQMKEKFGTLFQTTTTHVLCK